MAIDDQEEYEQGERVRNWLRNNGGSVIGGIAVGLSLIAGWNWWQHKQQLAGEKASDAYVEVGKAIDAGGDEKRLEVLVKGMASNYPKTPYASLAVLRLAAHKVDIGDAKGALATLEAMPTPSDAALGTLVKLREGRLLLILGHPADALKRIESVRDEAWTSVADEIRGDAEHALGHDDVARTHYASALAKLPEEAPNRQLLEMKLTEVGGQAAKPEDKKA